MHQLALQDTLHRLKGSYKFPNGRIAVAESRSRSFQHSLPPADRRKKRYVLIFVNVGCSSKGTFVGGYVFLISLRLYAPHWFNVDTRLHHAVYEINDNAKNCSHDTRAIPALQTHCPPLRHRGHTRTEAGQHDRLLGEQSASLARHPRIRRHSRPASRDFLAHCIIHFLLISVRLCLLRIQAHTALLNRHKSGGGAARAISVSFLLLILNERHAARFKAVYSFYNTIRQSRPHYTRTYFMKLGRSYNLSQTIYL